MQLTPLLTSLHFSLASNSALHYPVVLLCLPPRQTTLSNPLRTLLSTMFPCNYSPPHTREGKPLFKHFQRLCAEAHTAIPAEEELYSRRHGLFVPDSISASLSPLTQWTMNDVRNAIDEDLLQEAEQYVLNARVIHRQIDGTRLHAFLPTSDDGKHGFTVTYNIAEKCSALLVAISSRHVDSLCLLVPPRRECSCNAVFDCEHVVALLLAWVDDPSSFAPSKQAPEPVIPAAAATAIAARKLPEWMDGSESQGY